MLWVTQLPGMGKLTSDNHGLTSGDLGGRLHYTRWMGGNIVALDLLGDSLAQCRLMVRRYRISFCLLVVAVCQAGLCLAQSPATPSSHPVVPVIDQHFRQFQRLLQQGQPQAAERMAQNIVREILSAHGHTTFAAFLCSDVGRELMNASRRSAAYNILKMAASIANKANGKTSEDVGWHAVVLYRLAWCEQGLDKLSDALDHYEKALVLFGSIREKSRNTALSHCDTKLGYAFLLLQQSHYGRARKVLQEAIPMAVALGPSGVPLRLRALGALGDLADRIGDYERAAALCEQALSGKERLYGRSHMNVCGDLESLACVYGHMARYDEALALYRRCLSILETQLGMSHPRCASTYHLMAVSLSAQGKHGEAVASQVKAIELVSRNYGNAASMLWSHLNNLGWLEILSGDLVAAGRHLQRAQQAVDQSVGKGTPASANVMGNRALVAAQSGDIRTASQLLVSVNRVYEQLVQSLVSFGREQQKLSVMKRIQGKTHFAVELAQRHGTTHPETVSAALDVVLQRKGRVLDLSASYVERVRRGTPQQKQLMAELSEARARMATIILKGGDPGFVSALLSQAESIEDKLLQSLQKAAPVTTVTLRAVQSKIPQDAALVEYAFYREFDPEVPMAKRYLQPMRCVAFVVSREMQPRLIDIGRDVDIEPAIRDYLAAVRRSGTDGAQLKGRELDALLLQSVRKLVDPSVKRLLIAADGALHLVPFHALVQEDGKFLIESFEVSLLNSGRDLLSMKALGGRRGALALFGNPDYGQVSVGASRLSFTPLPGTEREVSALAELIPVAKLYAGKQASETALKALHQPRLLHIATHGFFLNSPPFAHEDDRGLKKVVQPSVKNNIAKRPEYAFVMEAPLVSSGLALAGANASGTEGDDGILTALEVMAMDLSSAQLVVLSACETGVGEVMNGAGVFGLRRSFFLAGADSMVMSLWPVHDDATCELMLKFYKNLLAGQGRAEALRAAQLDLVHNEKYGHPAYWAAFSFCGDWRPMSAKRK